MKTAQEKYTSVKALVAQILRKNRKGVCVRMAREFVERGFDVTGFRKAPITLHSDVRGGLATFTLSLGHVNNQYPYLPVIRIRAPQGVLSEDEVGGVFAAALNIS